MTDPPTERPSNGLDSDARSQADAFSRGAARGRPSFMSDVWYLARAHKKWWLLPLVVLLLAFGLLVFLSSTGAAPFIYTLF